MLRRARLTNRFTALAVVVVALAPAACAPDGASLTAPSAPQLATAPIGAMTTVDPKAAEKQAFEALSTGWRAYKDSVTRGGLEVTFARCEPWPTAGETKRIGPKGGSIKMGPHTLVIPAGALAVEVAITGTAPAGTVREVQFAPHGLRFLTPVRLTMNVDKCLLPDTAAAEIVYTGITGVVLEREPSRHDKVVKTVDAWTDHFSGYVVAYGRR